MLNSEFILSTGVTAGIILFPWAFAAVGIMFTTTKFILNQSLIHLQQMCILILRYSNKCTAYLYKKEEETAPVIGKQFCVVWLLLN